MCYFSPVIWWCIGGDLTAHCSARYWWMVSSLELPVSVDVHVHVNGVGETSLTLIDVVNGGSLIRQAWICWWNQDDYLACGWTKWCWVWSDVIAERRGTVWSSYREPRMMWIFDVIWESRRDRSVVIFRDSSRIVFVHCSVFIVIVL